MNKPLLVIVPNTEPSQNEKVRMRLRKDRLDPYCKRCASRSFIVMQTGKTKQKICAHCLSAGDIVNM